MFLGFLKEPLRISIEVHSGQTMIILIYEKLWANDNDRDTITFKSFSRLQNVNHLIVPHFYFVNVCRRLNTYFNNAINTELKQIPSNCLPCFPTVLVVSGLNVVWKASTKIPSPNCSRGASSRMEVMMALMSQVE